jgi:hypothetical protein
MQVSGNNCFCKTTASPPTKSVVSNGLMIINEPCEVCMKLLPTDYASNMIYMSTVTNMIVVVQTFEVITERLIISRMCSSGNYTQKWVTKL